MEKKGKAPPEPVIVLRGHAGDVQCLGFCSKTRRLFSGDIDGVLRVWDPDLYKPVAEITAHPAAGILSVCAAGDGTVFTQGREGAVKCWKLLPSGALSSSPLMTAQTGSYNFCRCAVVAAPPPGEEGGARDAEAPGSPEEAGAGEASTSGQSDPPPWVAVSGEDGGSLELWDMRSGSLACSFAPPQEAPDDPGKPAKKAGMVMAVAVVPGRSAGSVLGAGYEDGAVRLWDVRKPGSAPLCVARLHSETITCLSFHPGGRRGASGAAESKVVLFELSSSLGSIKPLAEQSIAAAGGDAEQRPGAGDLAFRQDGRVLAAACWDGRVRLFDSKQGKPLASLKYHAKAATAVAFLGPEDGGLATAGRDGAVALWKVYPTATATTTNGSALALA